MGKYSSINELENCLISPSANEKYIEREDIEFYIPQLCSFICDHTKDTWIRSGLASILCDLSFASFYFSHRLLLYLNSIFLHNNTNLTIETKEM